MSRDLMTEYIDLHRLRSYIDNCKIIPTSTGAQLYIQYMLKDFSKDHKRGIHFTSNRSDDQDLINDELIKQTMDYHYSIMIEDDEIQA